MATGKFCSAQDLALSVVGGLDTDVTDASYIDLSEYSEDGEFGKAVSFIRNLSRQ